MFTTSSRIARSRQFLLRQKGYNNAIACCTTQDVIREYHCTPKKEILPVIAGLGVLIVARYSYRAIKRMDEEWDEYNWELQQYERMKRSDMASSDAKFPGGTIGIDIGTFNVKLAKDKSILFNREGLRSTFGGLVQNGNDLLVGQRAFEKFYESQNADDSSVSMAGIDVTNSLSTVVQLALKDVLERNNTDLDKARSVVAVPPYKWDDYDAATKSLFPAIEKDSNYRVLVPEPVAAIWGAQTTKDIPERIDTPVIVVDIGATEINLSIVQKDIVLGTTTLDGMGGNLYVDAVVDLLLADDKEMMRNDGMALQRIYQAAHTAVTELNSQPSTEVHVPYVGMDLETREPKHLEERIVRAVVEKWVTDVILSTEVDSSKFSNHIPKPTSLSFWWLSLLTKLLDSSQMMPQNVSQILLVGGGAKQAMMKQSIRECLIALQGNDDALVVPQEISELVAIGASSMLQNYRYNSEIGLVREEE